jgi:hypothetical protein
MIDQLVAALRGIEPVDLKGMRLIETHPNVQDIGSVPPNELLAAIQELATYREQCQTFAEALLTIPSQPLAVSTAEYGL